MVSYTFKLVTSSLSTSVSVHNHRFGPLYLLQSAPVKLNLLGEDSRITTKDYSERVKNREAHILVDVQPEHHYKIVSLPISINIPLSTLDKKVSEMSSAMEQARSQKAVASGESVSLYVICRRGNDSQRAVHFLQNTGFASAKDIVGGIESWARDVDPWFPTY